jgi:Ca-activated chloride channel homolog
MLIALIPALGMLSASDMLLGVMLSRAGLLVFLASASLLTAQNIRVDTTLVVIPVTVTDPSSRFVLGLDQKSFSIFEDGTEQTIKVFSGEDAPLSVGILFDTSGSMELRTDRSRAAVSEFLKTLSPQDEAFLIQFADKPRLVQEFTSRTKQIEDRLATLKSGGLTALLDAVELGVREMKRAKNTRKALVVVSDGGDNNSRYTANDIKDIVKEADTQIYAMGVFEPSFFAGLPGEIVSGPKLLAQIADQTGGRAYGASEFSQLPGIAEKIAIELRNQYVLGYYPTNSERDGKYRKVEVKLKQPKGLPTLKARWRLGYYAPQD